VTSKALALGLRPIVCLNKVDKQEAEPDRALDEVFDLFVALDADEAQLDFPVLYASGRNGWADTSLEGPRDGLAPMFDLVMKHVPVPAQTGRDDEPFAMLSTTLEADPFLGALSLLDPEPSPPGRYPADPLAFIREVLGEDLWEGQERIVRAVWELRYTSVASCHGVGKTRVLADIAITYLHLHPNSIVLTTAPTGRQVEHVLWREIRAAYRRARQPLLGRPPLTTRYEIGDRVTLTIWREGRTLELSVVLKSIAG